MRLYDSTLDHSALAERLQSDPHGLLVVCYCAAWCNTCTQYRADFSALAEKTPQHVFIWVDIEEQPELLGDLDVDDFPTLLLQRRNPAANLFFGTQLPYISHLEKLLVHAEDLAAGAPVQGPPPLEPLLQTA